MQSSDLLTKCVMILLLNVGRDVVCNLLFAGETVEDVLWWKLSMADDIVCDVVCL